MSRRFPRAGLAVLGVALIVPLAAIAGTTGGPAPPQTRPDTISAAASYHQPGGGNAPPEDAKVRLDVRVLPAQALLDEVRPQVGLRLLIEDRWTARPVAAACRELPAPGFMDALAELFAARWYLVQQRRWILARSPQSAAAGRRREELRETALGGPTDHFRGATRRLADLIHSFTPEQWKRLEAGVRLSPRDLRPAQWALLRQGILLHMEDPGGPGPHTPLPEALQGQVLLWLRPATADGIPARIAFQWPRRSPAAAHSAGLEVTINRTPAAGWAVPDIRAPLPAEPPGARGRGPDGAPRPATPADYREDPRFRRALEMGREKPAWREALQALHDRTGASFAVQGDWLLKELPPGAAAGSCRSLMDRMAVLARGAWKPVGEVWILVERPREEAAPARLPGGRRSGQPGSRPRSDGPARPN